MKRTTHLTVKVTERAQVIKAVGAAGSSETNKGKSSGKPPKSSKATQSKPGRATAPASA